MTRAPQEPLTTAQQELYDWLADYIGTHRHSPSIRQMMQAMGLRSPAPIQSRLRHLQQKGWITWQEGQARTGCCRDSRAGRRCRRWPGDGFR